jgi:hypothetical protein
MIVSGDGTVIGITSWKRSTAAGRPGPALRSVRRCCLSIGAAAGIGGVAAVETPRQTALRPGCGSTASGVSA